MNAETAPKGGSDRRPQYTTPTGQLTAAGKRAIRDGRFPDDDVGRVRERNRRHELERLQVRARHLDDVPPRRPLLYRVHGSRSSDPCECARFRDE